MKAIFALLILMIGMVMVSPQVKAADPPGQMIVIGQQHLAPLAVAQEEGGVAVDQQAAGDQGIQIVQDAEKPIGELLLENWWEITMAFLALIEVIARITPTQKDNSILNFVHKLLEVILPANKKKGGGTFMVRSNP